MFIKPRRKVDRVFLHCSAASRKSVVAAEINRWHLERGWSGIGYHFFIKSDGLLEPARNINKTPASAKGHNRGTIAICLNGLDIEDFSQRQFETLRTLCLEIDFAYGGKVTFHGHREVAAKACPVFDYRKVLNLNSRGQMLADQPVPDLKKLAQATTPNTPYLDAVQVLSLQLKSDAAVLNTKIQQL